MGMDDKPELKKVLSHNDSFDEGIVDDLDKLECEVNSGRHSSQADSTPKSVDSLKKDNSPDSDKQQPLPIMKPNEIKTSIEVKGKKSPTQDNADFDDDESIDDFIKKHLDEAKGTDSAEK